MAVATAAAVAAPREIYERKQLIVSTADSRYEYYNGSAYISTVAVCLCGDDMVRSAPAALQTIAHLRRVLHLSVATFCGQGNSLNPHA